MRQTLYEISKCKKRVLETQKKLHRHKKTNLNINLQEQEQIRKGPNEMLKPDLMVSATF